MQGKRASSGCSCCEVLHSLVLGGVFPAVCLDGFSSPIKRISLTFLQEFFGTGSLVSGDHHNAAFTN